MIGFLKNLVLYPTQGSWEKLETHARQLSGPSDQWLWIYSTRNPIPINAPRLDLEYFIDFAPQNFKFLCEKSNILF